MGAFGDCAARSFCGEYPQNVLISTPSQRTPQESDRSGQPKLYKHPLHKHSTIMSKIQWARLKWALARCGSNKYICRGARRERANPNDTTTRFP